MESKYYIELKFPNGKILKSKVKPPVKIRICNGNIIKSEPIGIKSGIDIDWVFITLISIGLLSLYISLIIFLWK